MFMGKVVVYIDVFMCLCVCVVHHPGKNEKN